VFLLVVAALSGYASAFCVFIFFGGWSFGCIYYLFLWQVGFVLVQLWMCWRWGVVAWLHCFAGSVCWLGCCPYVALFCFGFFLRFLCRGLVSLAFAALGLWYLRVCSLRSLLDLSAPALRVVLLLLCGLLAVLLLSFAFILSGVLVSAA